MLGVYTTRVPQSTLGNYFVKHDTFIPTNPQLFGTKYSSVKQE